MSRQYIYTIERLSKKIGPREVLKDIWLAFYPGAKIGVLGRNGAGKSTLLRIMAGSDKEVDGEARITDGFTRGYLSQEPQLTAGLDVWGNLQEAIALFVPGGAARRQTKKIVEKIFGCRVFIETPYQIGNGTVEIFRFHHGCIEQQPTGLRLYGPRLVVGHTFQHFKFDLCLHAVSLAQQERIGKVK